APFRGRRRRTCRPPAHRGERLRLALPESGPATGLRLAPSLRPPSSEEPTTTWRLNGRRPQQRDAREGPIYVKGNLMASPAPSGSSGPLRTDAEQRLKPRLHRIDDMR